MTARCGDGDGDGEGDGSTDGLGLATTAAPVVDDALRSRSAIVVPTNSAAATIRARAISCCFDVNDRLSGTERLQIVGLASSDPPAATTAFSGAVKAVGLTTVTSLRTGLAAML